MTRVAQMWMLVGVLSAGRWWVDYSQSLPMPTSDIVVTDEAGVVVHDLTKDELRIKLGGKPVEIVVFEPAPVGYTVGHLQPPGYKPGQALRFEMEVTRKGCKARLAPAPTDEPWTDTTSVPPRSEPDVIQADVMVTNKRGERVADIARDEIELWEDGVAVKVVDWQARPTHYEVTFHPHAGRPLKMWRQTRVIVKRKDLKIQTRLGYRLSDERARRE